MKNYIIGVDVGGTNIKMGIVNSRGTVIDRNNLMTSGLIGHKNDLINALLNSIKGLAKKNKLSLSCCSGVGIGLPGSIDPVSGIVHRLTNIPGWNKVALKKIIEERLGVPAFLENDVSMITLAEWKYGAGIGCRNMICITLGTGVGGGLILNNELYRGEGFAAGEVGHVPLNETGPACNCGGFGCFEQYVGNRTLKKKIDEIFRKEELKIQDVRKLAEKGNKKALRFWQDTAVHIGNGLVGVVNLLNPARIVIGGGISNNHRFLLGKVREVIRTRAMKTQASMVSVVRAKLGDDAGIIGACVLISRMQNP